MGRKQKAPQPDTARLSQDEVEARFRDEADAIIRRDYGIYSETLIDAQHPASHTLVAKLRDAAKAGADAPRLTALQRAHALRQRMRTIIAAAVINDGDGLPERWATITADIGDGLQTHLCAAERIAGVEQAEGVLTMIDVFLFDDPSEREAQIFLNGITTGRLLEMMKVLPFEPLVLSRKASNKPLDKINKDRPSSSQLKREAEMAIELMKKEYPNRSSDIDFIKTKAAASLSIKKRALNTRLKP